MHGHIEQDMDDAGHDEATEAKPGKGQVCHEVRSSRGKLQHPCDAHNGCNSRNKRRAVAAQRRSLSLAAAAEDLHREHQE
eukprot:scaffold31_cov263-Pinguiococcus_pyrenoidosus.AAC.23